MSNPFQMYKKNQLAPQMPRPLHGATSKESRNAYQLAALVIDSNLAMNQYQSSNRSAQPQYPPRFKQQTSMINQPNNPFPTAPHGQKARSADNLSMNINPRQTNAAFKTIQFSVNTEHEAYISSFENGPELFSVQLKAHENNLKQMKNELNKVNLRVLDHTPLQGEPVIARFSKNEQLRRAVIMAVKSPDTCFIAYVDYGNSEIVRFDSIFQIPNGFLDPPIFAYSFALSNLNELGDPIGEDVKIKFYKLVSNKLLLLKIAPWQGPCLVQYCKLYDGDRDILEMLVDFKVNKNLCHSFVPLSLNTGATERIFVCYIHSAQQFYVQLVSQCQMFEKMIDMLEENCKSASQPSELKPGMYVAARYDDGSWYRAQIHQVLNGQVLAQFIDFGNYEKIAFNDLRLIHEKYMKIPPQAIECCLNGFEEIDYESDATRTQFELMVQQTEQTRKILKLHVINQIRKSVVLVELFDENINPPLNITKRICKLSMPQIKYNNIIGNMQRNAAIVNSTANSHQTTMWENNTQSSLNESDMVDSGKNSASLESNGHIAEPNVYHVQQPVQTKFKSLQVTSIKPEIMSCSSQLTTTKPKLCKTESLISCWYSPHEFFVQLKNSLNEFENMMRRIQDVYKNGMVTVAQNPIVDAYVVAKYAKDNFFYRARTTDYNAQLNKFKVEFVDVGNRAIVPATEIYPIAKEFAQYPTMAVKCSLNNIISCREWTDLITDLDKYINANVQNKMCTFIRSENERYFVDIEIDGIDLKKRLISDNFVLDLPNNIDPNFLKDQIVLLKIGKIKSLLHFFGQLDGYDFYWPCSYTDVQKGKGTESELEFKNTYSNKTSVALIKNVTHTNILSISLDVVKDLYPLLYCSVPCFMQTFNATIEHYESSNVFFVRPKHFANAMYQLLDEMYDFYESNGTTFKIVQQNQLYAVKSVDDNWYRAQIMSILNNETVEVKYIDYGNVESIPIQNVKKLETQFQSSAKILKLSLCFIRHDEIADSDVLSIIKDWAGNEVTLTLVQAHQNAWIGNVSNEKGELGCFLLEKKMVKKISIEEVKSQIDRNSKIVGRQQVAPSSVSQLKSVDSNEKPLDEFNYHHGILCHVDDPERFYIYLIDHIKELELLSTNLQIVAPSLAPLGDFKVGTYCIAKHSMQDKWYRAKINGNDSEMITLQYIDYGWTDVILDFEAAANMLKENCEISPKSDGYALACSLAVKPVRQLNDEWIEPACADLRLFVNEEVYFKEISRTPQKMLVDVFKSEENLTDRLVSKGYAVAYRPIVSGEKCYTSHINSLSEFYFQLDRDVESLEKMADDLLDIERFPDLKIIDDSNVNCIAFFPDDSHWYRAKILGQNNDETVDVFYLDYGNHATIQNTLVKKLDSSFDKIPPLAFKCALQMPPNILKWSDAAESKFLELAGNGSTEFIVQLLETDLTAPSIVSLSIEGEDIVKMLQDLCETIPLNQFEKEIQNIQKTLMNTNHLIGQVAVVTYTSPSSFFVVYKATEEILQKIDGFLANTDLPKIESPAVGEMCAARYYSDNNFYRAEVVSDENNIISVNFIDYGNERLATDFRKLPDSLQNIKPFAYHCKMINSDNLNEKEMQTLEEYVMKTDSVFEIEVIDANVNPMLVQLKQNNIDVIDLLEAGTSGMVPKKST